MVDAPSVQSFEVRIDKLWKNHPITNYFTAPPLLWTVSPLDACAQSQNNAQDRAGTSDKRQECLILARKGPIRLRTCKNVITICLFVPWLSLVSAAGISSHRRSQRVTAPKFIYSKLANSPTVQVWLQRRRMQNSTNPIMPKSSSSATLPSLRLPSLASCSKPSFSVNATFFRSHFLHLFSFLGRLPNDTLKARLFFFVNCLPQYSQSGCKRNFPMACHKQASQMTASQTTRQTVAPHRGASIIIKPGFPAYVRRAPDVI